MSFLYVGAGTLKHGAPVLVLRDGHGHIKLQFDLAGSGYEYQISLDDMEQFVNKCRMDMPEGDDADDGFLAHVSTKLDRLKSALGANAGCAPETSSIIALLEVWIREYKGCME